MVAHEESQYASGAPDWVVTYGDMMSLLLTFFVMLVSMSEVTEQQRYQAMVDSLHRQFGYDLSFDQVMPGEEKPRNSILDFLATLGRARRTATMDGGDKVRAPVGDNPRVRNIRPGKQVAMGGTFYFDESEVELTEHNKRQLQIAAQELGGKTQKIEIRGHASHKPLAKNSPYGDRWDLAYARCRKVMQFLAQLGIDPVRFRIAVAANNEPLYLGSDRAKQTMNSRVEVVMMDEWVEDLEGSPEEREKLYEKQ
jgi:chemotaxis protein MotB